MGVRPAVPSVPRQRRLPRSLIETRYPELDPDPTDPLSATSGNDRYPPPDMFPTFSGNSRRPRNVNLSGQKNSNPFAATSWGTGAATGASKTVADAAAERQQRQQERKRRQAVHNIQRVWRAHRVRRNLRAAYRAEFDDIYSSDSMLDVEDRIRQAFPLLMSVFDASQPTDLERLARLGKDLLQTSLTPFDSGQIHPARLNKLSRAVIRALEA